MQVERKYMKINTLLSSVLSVILGLSVNLFPAYANEEDITDYEHEIERIVEKAKSDYSVSSISELPDEIQNKLLDEVDTLKQKMIESDPSLIISPYFGGEYEGKIFVTRDSKTSGFAHGHAGIGARGTGEVIEANPGDGVKLYTNRINGYWKTVSASVMAVSGATTAIYSYASDYAYSKLGTPYSLDVWDGTAGFYCSELVLCAWNSAGIPLLSGTQGFPADIYASSKTITTLTYNGGFK